MIQLVDLKKQYQTLKKDIDTAVKGVINRCDFIMGEDLHAFEKEFADFCEAKYAVGVDSGTGALELAFHALGLGPGDEVIVPCFTFYATASAVASVGAKPVFVDIDAETGNMDPERLESAVGPRTKAVVPVHLFGQPVNMQEIVSFAKRRNLHLVEDAAQAHGAKFKMENIGWKVAGSVGEMACFSFYPGKNLGAYGDGGAVVTQSGEIAEKLKLLRDYGRTAKYEHSILGYNRRLDTIQAAILRVKLRKLAQWNEARRKHADLYDRLLGEIGVGTIKVSAFTEPVRHVYAIRAPNRDALASHLKEKGVATGVHYPIPLHLQKSFAYLGYKEGAFPVAEKLASEILSLPMYPELKESEVKSIVGHIKSFYKK